MCRRARWYFCAIAHSFRISRSLAAGLALFLTALICAGPASAGDKFKYSVVLRPASYSGSPSGSVKVSGLDPSKSATLRITVGAVAAAPLNYPTFTDDYISIGSRAFVPGDTITVEQPTGTTLETFTIPDVSLTGAAGSASLTGRAPDGTVAVATYEDVCFGRTADSFTVQPQGGAFAVKFPKPLVPGSPISVFEYPGKGDVVKFEDFIPGETPCLFASAQVNPPYPGSPADPQPYSLQANELRGVVATGVRLALRRNGVIVVDDVEPSSTGSAYVATSVKPLPGDVVELYRPHTAPAPSATFTIPSLAAVYDPSNSLVAVDAPAASYIETEAGFEFAMFSATRIALNTNPGRTLLDFSSAQGAQRPFSLSRLDVIETQWYSQDATHGYSVNPAPGDLSPPQVSIKLAKKFKFSKIGSSIAASITSNEAATASLKLTLPGTLKTSASKSKPKSPRVVATANVAIAAGVTKVKVKLTKSGKKLIAKMRKNHYPANKATLTLVATDFSGNASTATKSTKLAPR